MTVYKVSIMKHSTIIAFLTLMFMSCDDVKKTDYSLENVPIVIDIDSVMTDSLKISYLKYIPLETSAECLMGGPSKVLIRDNKIYVADNRTTMTLFVFDINGKFLFKISKRGQGPNEYISFKDFDIQTNGDIYIHDSFGKKFVVFNSEGVFQRSIKVDDFFTDFCLFDDKIYLSEPLEYGKMLAALAVYDMKDKRTEYLLKEEELLHDLGLINSSQYKFYHSPNDIVYYSPKFSGIIFSIDKDGIHPAIGIKNLKIPSREITDGWMKIKDTSEQINLILSSDYFKENIYIFETDKYITFTPVRRNKDIFMYKKNAKSVSKFKTWDFYSNIGISNIEGSDGKNFFSVILFNPEKIESHRKILETYKELENWDEEDNPVIVIFNFDN